MAEIVSFKIRIDDEGSFKKVEVDADDLRRGIGTVVDETRRLNSGLINMAQVGQVFDQLGSAIGQISSSLGTLTEAYSVQEAAETRLAQAMRNTMGASLEDVEAIKQLCGAQQQLGIIGDEVQLSGAQELATYLEKRSSLERLIPVMNDMLAQQYEYNATSENAAQIASMLGKVMNGQTEALSRYGYKFDEAQKKILQFGTEEERAAVLAEVVQQSVGGMNVALAQTPTGRMAQAANLAGDLKEQLGAAAARVMPLVQGLASVTQAATGMGKITTSVKSLTAALRAAEISSKALRASMLGIAGIVFTGVIAAMGILAKKSQEARKEAEKANEVYREMQSRLATARSEVEMDIQKLGAFNGSIAEQKRLVGEMNTKWGDAFGTFNTVSEWYKTLSENVDAYCTRLANQIELEKIANDIANAKNDNPKLQDQLDYLKRQRDAVKDQPMITGGGEMGMASPFQAKSTSGFDQQIDTLEATIRANEETISNGEARMQELLAKMAAMAVPSPGPGGGGGAGGGKTLADDIEKYRKSVQSALEVNEAFNNGQDEYVAQANAMKSGLVALIRQYGIENAEVQKLVQEYYELRKAKMGAMLTDVNPVSSLPFTLEQPGDTGSKPSSADFNVGDGATKNLISMQDAAAVRMERFDLSEMVLQTVLNEEDPAKHSG